MVTIEDNAHIELIRNVAYDLARKNQICIQVLGRNIDEYMGEGYLSLLVAKKNFKPELGVSFRTYASAVIRSRIIRFAKKHGYSRELVEKTMITDNFDEISEELSARLDQLDEKTRDVIVMRFGLDGCERMTLDEVGNFFQLTKARVQQIEKRGLKQLRDIICDG